MQNPENSPSHSPSRPAGNPNSALSLPFSIEASTYQGSAAELMRPGSALPFLQPWYTPLSCTPKDTGMPMGGIGSAFTMTPAGTTPAFSGLGGLHITPAPEHKGAVDGETDGEGGGSMRLHSAFFAEREADAELQVVDAGGLLRRNRYFPLRNGEGQPWLKGNEDPKTVAAILARMAADPGLYAVNAADIERWHIEISPRTRALIAKTGQGQVANKASSNNQAELSRSLLLDFFGGSLALKPSFAASLIGNVEATSYAGYPAYDAAAMDYAGLYPLARTRFAAPGQALRLTRLAYSPVARHDERACSLPVSGYSYTVENPTDRPIEATLALTLENFCGDEVIKTRPGVQDAWFYLIKTARYQKGEALTCPLGAGRTAQGLLLSQEAGQASGDWRGAMALLVEAPDAWVTLAPEAYAAAEAGLVKDALSTGRIAAGHGLHLPSGRERGLGAICVTWVIPPHSKREAHFALSLDLPDVALRGVTLAKKYTTYYPAAEGRAAAMAAEVLRGREALLKRITADHAAMPTLGGMPSLFQGAPMQGEPARKTLTLMANTLGFLADATVWTSNGNDPKRDRFLIRECADYPFFNSLDVYFYGSFAVMHLLPRLDGCVLREFADAILAEDPRTRRHWEYMHEPYADLPEARLEGPRGVAGAVPHDMGSPFDPDPDAYIWHNVKHWKDLAPKYLLMVWRHFKATGDESLLRDCWPAARAALDYLDAMREKGDSLPLTDGTDDTFDNLESRGVSVYCGSLWVAALLAGEAMAKVLGDTAKAGAWRTLADAARETLSATLWREDEGYYRFWVDARRNESSDDVFADQLLADLWLRLLKLPVLTPDDRARRAAEKVLRCNWREHSPWVGAANLVGPQGETLEAFQAQDVWLGVQYSIVAICARVGLKDEAVRLLDTCYANLYDLARIPFGAPEGFNGSVALGSGDLAKVLGLDAQTAEAWHRGLQKAGMLNAAGRPLAGSRLGYPEFAARLGTALAGETSDPGDTLAKLHAFLQGHALQYTAGRYLRPGMIWVLASAE
jgi:non-lysosomal glucosylceramidase